MECSGRRCKGFCPYVFCKAVAFPAGDLRGRASMPSSRREWLCDFFRLRARKPTPKTTCHCADTVARQLLSPVPPHLQKVESPPSTVAEWNLTDRSKPPVVVKDRTPLFERIPCASDSCCARQGVGWAYFACAMDSNACRNRLPCKREFDRGRGSGDVAVDPNYPCRCSHGT